MVISTAYSPQAGRAVKWIAVLCAVHVLLLAFFSGEPMIEYVIDSNIRYAAPLAPFAAIAAALTLAALTGARAWLRAALVAAWIGTNLFSLCAPLRPPAPLAFRSFLAEFCAETFRLTSLPPSSTEAAIEDLRQASRQDDVVFVWPDYRRDSLIFYLGDRLLFCGALPAGDKRIIPRAAGLGLPPYVWSPRVCPDIIVGFGFPPRGSRKELYNHATSLPEFRAAKTRVLYIWYDELARPELTRRNLHPPAVTPRNRTDGIFIIERRR